MIKPLAFGSKRVKTSRFADFIKNAKSEEKKRVYSVVLTEANRQQCELLTSMEASRA